LIYPAYPIVATAFAALILYVGSLADYVSPANIAMLTVSVRKISAYQIAPVVFAALILYVVSLVGLVPVPKPVILLANASVLKTAAVAFAAPIQFVGGYVESVLVS